MKNAALTLRIIYRLGLYLIGLAGTCIGLSLCLKSTMGVDAWNAAIAGLAGITPISIGTWTIIVHLAFWIISTLLSRKIKPGSIFPVLYKGVILDIVKPWIDNYVFAGNMVSLFLLFVVGYLIIAVSTGIYIATEYPRMPVDGLMFSLATFLHADIKKARLLIEFAGFTTMIFARGKFGLGTVIMTLTCGYAFAICKSLSEKILFNKARLKFLGGDKMYSLELAQPKDAAKCYAIIQAAKEFQREQGFIQWTEDYPNESTIREDIATGKGYVLTVDQEIAGYMCIDFSGEPAYANIEGAWNTEIPYAVVHRMAFSQEYRGKGLSSVALRLVADLCLSKGVNSIRVDTDFRNTRMQHILEKCGFSKCGVIVFQGSGKLAYDKKL